MKLTIEDTEKEFTVNVQGTTDLCSIIAQNTFYYTGVSDWKPTNNDTNNQRDGETKKIPAPLEDQLNNSPRNHQQPSSQNNLPDDVTEKTDNSITNGEQKSLENVLQTKGKTPRLIDWIINQNKKNFDLEDFYDRYPQYKDKPWHDNLMDLISRLINENKITQMGNTKFKVNI